MMRFSIPRFLLNEGTLIKDANTPPTKPKAWGGNKLQRAIATVAF
ncbi:MAG: hypothetical protein O3B76_10025 [Proteobacteria bacterium]|nr:hypothetical protein [Pseudomonadota bacterium]MDA1023301.1 hypothetical protein [Pseudomonadota bacterium]